MAKGLIPVSNDNAKGKQWLARWGKMLTWLGPLVVLFGILQLVGIV